MLNFELNQDDSALLIIDFQEKLMRVMPDRERVYKSAKLLLATAKQLNIPVIITEQYPAGLGHTVEDIKGNLCEHCCVEKNSFSACTAELNEVVQNNNRKNIIVLGSETHICVFQTTRGLIRMGYNVFVVRDGVCSRTQENYENGLDLMNKLGAVITNTETVIFDLLKKSGTPEFKAISPLLK